MVTEFKFFKTYEYRLTLWKDRHGREHDIRSLTTNHIHNILLCLSGEGESFIPNPYEGRTRMEWSRIFCEELNRREIEEL